MNDTPEDNPSPDAPDRRDLSNRQLGDFRLLRRLGRGAMAEVYLAEQESLKRRVAVKILRSELANDETYVRRFRREAQAAASLLHGNIVQIHEIGRRDDIEYIAQEYVRGVNLHQWLERRGRAEPTATVHIMRQVAAALAKAAEHDIVHRDIKPENIMLTPGGEVKVADFGLARLPRDTEGVDLTQVGTTLGTPLYMSPEQVEGRPLDSRSDLYSLGVTCYHLLAGNPPFTGDTPLSVAVQHLKKDPPPLADARPDLPDALCRIVHQLLAKNPADRPASAQHLLRDLNQFQQDHPGLEPLDASWSEDLAAWESGSVERTSGVPNATTQRLQAVMSRANQPTRSKRRGLLQWAVYCLIAAIIGAAIAYLAPVDPPLL